MKTAIYIEDGLTQVVLTPETDAEENALALVHGATNLEVYHDEFYECRGGWIRQRRQYEGHPHFGEPTKGKSTMIVCRKKDEARFEKDKT